MRRLGGVAVASVFPREVGAPRIVAIDQLPLRPLGKLSTPDLPRCEFVVDRRSALIGIRVVAVLGRGWTYITHGLVLRWLETTGGFACVAVVVAAAGVP
jgi:hypothetical protein